MWVVFCASLFALCSTSFRWGLCIDCFFTLDYLFLQTIIFVTFFIINPSVGLYVVRCLLLCNHINFRDMNSHPAGMDVVSLLLCCVCMQYTVVGC